MWPAPVQEANRAGAARSAMWDIGQARRRTLSASSTGPLGCLSAGISSVGRLNRMPRYAFRRPALYLPRRKSNAGRMECEKCGLAARLCCQNEERRQSGCFDCADVLETSVEQPCADFVPGEGIGLVR